MTSTKAEQLSMFVQGMQEIPTIPEIVHKVLAIIDDPDSSVSDLERVISRDQTSAAKLLKLANSAYYGFNRRVATVHQAIIVIGFNAVKSIVIGLSVFDQFHTTNATANKLLKGLWMHSLGAATVAKEIALRTSLATPESAFICGLLHDFGKVLFFVQGAERYLGVVQAAARQACEIRLTEQQEYGFDHADLGGWMIDRWNLPIDIVAAAREHHLPATGEIGAMSKIVCVANALVHEVKLGWSGYDASTPLSPDVLIALGLSTESRADLRAYLESEQPKIQTFFDVMVAA